MIKNDKEWWILWKNKKNFEKIKKTLKKNFEKKLWKNKNKKNIEKNIWKKKKIWKKQKKEPIFFIVSTIHIS